MRLTGLVQQRLPALVLLVGAAASVATVVGPLANLSPLALMAIVPGAAAAYAISEYQRHQSLDRLLVCPPIEAGSLELEHIGTTLSPIVRNRTKPDGEAPGYVAREPQDGQILELLRTERLAVIKGVASAGKTRTAFEAVKSDDETFQVVIPKKPTADLDPLRMLIAKPWLLATNDDYVLFLDDLEEWIAGLSMLDLRKWLKVHSGSRVIGTISAVACQQLLSREGGSPASSKPLLRADTVITIQRTLTGAAVTQARRLYGDSPEVVHLGPYLASADEVIELFDAYAETQPTAHYLGLAAVECARTGLTRPIAADRLRDAAKRLAPQRELADEEWAAASELCTTSIKDVTALLIERHSAGGGTAFAANPVLVEYVEQREARNREPAQLAAATWRMALEVVAESDIDRLAIAASASDRGQAELARLLWEGLEQKGDNPSAVRASAALTAPDREDEPEDLTDLLAQAVTRGSSSSSGPSDDQVRYSDSLHRDAKPFDSTIYSPRGWRRFYRHLGWRSVLRTSLLFLCDLVGLLAGVAIAQAADAFALNDTAHFSSVRDSFLVATGVGSVLFASYGLYQSEGPRARLGALMKATALTAVVVSLLVVSRGHEVRHLSLILVAGAGAASVSFALRWGYDLYSRYWVKHNRLQARVLLVAPNEAATHVAELLLDACRRPMQFVGFVSNEPSDHPARLGSLADTERLVLDAYVSRVILADPRLSTAQRSRLASRCHGVGVMVEVMPSDDDLVLGSSEALVDHVVPLIEVPPLYLSRFNAGMKRVIDLVLALMAIALFVVPLMIMVAVMQIGTSREDPFVRELLPGWGAIPFPMYRLRTSRRGRRSTVGALLSRLRMNEIPQLLNVLRGDMSIVGPRPLSRSDFRELDPAQRRRYAVKPGITGLWQTAWRKRLTLADMTALDLIYCRKWTPLLDLTIILGTLPAILSQPARSPENEPIPPKVEAGGQPA